MLLSACAGRDKPVRGRAQAALGGRHPDYWAFLTETAAVRETANRVVANIREDRAAGR